MKMQSTPQISQMNGPIPLSFCIVLYQDGRVERLVDRPLEEYFSAIRTAGVAWIDCSTKDDNREFGRSLRIYQGDKCIYTEDERFL